MIIHSPIISGSLTFADGASVTYPEGGVYSGSFSGSFQGDSFAGGTFTGDGSSLTFGGTGIVSSSAQIDNLFNLDGVFSQSVQIDHDQTTNFSADEHFTQANITTVGTIGTGVWQGTAIDKSYLDDEVLNTSLNSETASISSAQAVQNSRLSNLESATGSYQPTLSITDTSQVDLILSSNTLSVNLKGGVVSGSAQITDVLSSLNSYTSSNDTTNSTQNSRLNQLSTETGSISSEQSVQDGRLSNLESATGSYLTTVDISSDTNLAVSDTSQVDMILSGDTLSANLKGGVVSGSAQITDVLSSLNTYTGSTVQPHIDSTSNPHSVTKTQVGLGNVTNESKSTMFASPTFTGTVSGVTKSHVGLGNVENTALSTWGGSSNITTLGTVTTGDVQAILPSGTVSGSDQIDFITIQPIGVISGSEQIEDVVGDMVTGNTETGISVAYQDGDGTLDFAVQYGSSANTAVQGNTSLSFAGTSNEISIDGGSSITLGSGGTVTIGLADTIAGNRTFSNNVTISGNLTVSGTTTSVNSNTVNIGDNILVLNSDESGTPSQDGGIEIERGTSTNATLIWDEGNDYWSAGLSGAEVQIALVNGTYSGLRAQSTTAGDVGLGNVTNESKATMFSSPTFTGTVSGVTKSHVGLGNVENTALSTYTGQGGALDNQYITNGAGYITSFTNTNQLTTFQVEDGDGTEVTISHGKEWKFVEGTGIDINWTDTSNGTDGDPYDLTITNTAPMTGDEFDNDGTYASLRAQGTTKGDVGLGNVTNESKSTMFASPTFTGTVSGVTKSHVGLGNVENTALSTYTGNGGALDNQYITNGAGYITSFDITTQTDSKYLRSNANDTATGIITLSNSTASTTKTTGALVVTGGVGVSGALNVGGDVVAYASSDERLKDNIELISNPIEKVQSLKGVTWNWNENADELQQSLPNVGVIAQDVEKVLPQLVTDRDNGFKGVDYAKLTGLLIEAIKEQQKQIDELKSKIQ